MSRKRERADAAYETAIRRMHESRARLANTLSTALLYPDDEHNGLMALNRPVMQQRAGRYDALNDLVAAEDDPGYPFP